jgi:ABC-type phosphate transport system substrate-binding protein
VRNRNRMLLVVGAALAAIGLSAAQALADPPTTPQTIDIVGTGSDTTQFVVDQFSTDYNATVASTDPHLYSWDAVGSSPITEKAGCGSRTRPNGSGAGITELEANLTSSLDSTKFCVDFARSSRARAATDPSTIVFIPFAIDAVTWSANSTSNAPADLSTNELTAIYSCDASLLGTGHTGPVTWDEVGGTGTAAVVPVIPQSNSGTRAFFLQKIGNPTLGSCVKGQDNSVEENEGTNAIFSGADAANIVFPYSVAVYLAQTEHNHGAGDQGSLVLKNVNTKSPTTVSGSGHIINSNFDYVRDVYNVVRNAGTGSTRAVPGYLQAIFGHGVRTGWICTNAGPEIADYGFLPFANCGILQ